MEHSFKIIITIALVIGGLYFLDKVARSNGIFGVLLGIVAIIIVGAGFYSVIWVNNDDSDKKDGKKR